MTEIANAVSPDDPSDVVLVGLCSSAYQALDSAIRLHPLGVIALNPVITFQPPEMLAGGKVDERRRVALPRGAVIQQFMTKVRSPASGSVSERRLADKDSHGDGQAAFCLAQGADRLRG